jgi:hypothetical protein
MPAGQRYSQIAERDAANATWVTGVARRAEVATTADVSGDRDRRINHLAWAAPRSQTAVSGQLRLSRELLDNH